MDNMSVEVLSSLNASVTRCLWRDSAALLSPAALRLLLSYPQIPKLDRQ